MKSQRGLSLIELMIALTLGLFLTASIIQVFAGSRQAANVVDAQSSMQEAARFGFHFISSSVRQAGYLNAGDIVANQQFPGVLMHKFQNAYKANAAQPNNPFGNSAWAPSARFEAASVVAGVDSYSGSTGSSVKVKPNSDMLAVRLMGEEDPGRPNIFDCEGVPIDATAEAEIIFFVSDDNQLYCQVDGRRPVALVAGIEDMQVEYGVASSQFTDNAYQVDRFRTATDMAVDDWPTVMLVRVALIARSERTVFDKSTQRLSVLSAADTRVFNDGRARQVFTQSIALRGNLSN